MTLRNHYLYTLTQQKWKAWDIPHAKKIIEEDLKDGHWGSNSLRVAQRRCTMDELEMPVISFGPENVRVFIFGARNIQGFMAHAALVGLM